MQGDEIRRRYHADLHSHMYSHSRDCDGPLETAHVWWLKRTPLDVIADTPTADYDFVGHVLRSVANFATDDGEPCSLDLWSTETPIWHDHSACLADHDCGPEVTDCDCFATLTLRHVGWGYQTDEGFAAGESTICADPRCTDESWRRDHYAEAAGY